MFNLASVVLSFNQLQLREGKLKVFDCVKVLISRTAVPFETSADNRTKLQKTPKAANPLSPSSSGASFHKHREQFP